MIHHVVIWRLRDDAKRAAWAATLERIHRHAAAMRTAIPGLTHVEIGANRSASVDAADLIMRLEFDSWTALENYEIHPLHEELRELIKPVRVERRVVDYELA